MKVVWWARRVPRDEPVRIPSADAEGGGEVGDHVSELAWHIGKPGDDKVSLVVCNVVFYEPKE